MASERFVFFRPGALGDALLAFPTLALLREARPEARVAVVGRRDVLPLARASRLADVTYAFDLPAWSALFAVEEAPASELLAPEAPAGALVGAHVIAWLPDADGRLRNRLLAFGAAAALVAPGRPRPGHATHMSLQLAQSLRPLGVAVPGESEWPGARSHRLCSLDAEGARAQTLLTGLGASPRDRVIAIHPGSGGSAKRWPPSSFAALASLLASRGLLPLLIEGPQDLDVCAAVQAHCPVPLPVARDLPVATLAALLGLCAGYVGNDSGVSHLAGLAGTPTLALFGPTDPAVWAPLGPRVRALRSPTGSMQDLSAPSVVGALSELIERPPQ